MAYLAEVSKFQGTASIILICNLPGRIDFIYICIFIRKLCLLPGGPSRRVIDPGMIYPSTPFSICNHVEFFLWRRFLKGPTKHPTTLFPNVSYSLLGVSNFLEYLMPENRTTCNI